jgi:hypothetical protein
VGVDAAAVDVDVVDPDVDGALAMRVAMSGVNAGASVLG